MTPKTTSAPAAAPSVASETAKQLASLAMRTSRPSRALEIGLERPAEQPGRVGVLDQAGRGDSVPGMPTPTVPTRTGRHVRDPRPSRQSHRSSRHSRRAACRRAARATSRLPSSAMPSILVPPSRSRFSCDGRARLDVGWLLPLRLSATAARTRSCQGRPLDRLAFADIDGAL